MLSSLGRASTVVTTVRPRSIGASVGIVKWLRSPSIVVVSVATETKVRHGKATCSRLASRLKCLGLVSAFGVNIVVTMGVVSTLSVAMSSIVVYSILVMRLSRLPSVVGLLCLPILAKIGMKVARNEFLVKTWCRKPGTWHVTMKVLAVDEVLKTVDRMRLWMQLVTCDSRARLLKAVAECSSSTVRVWGRVVVAVGIGYFGIAWRTVGWLLYVVGCFCGFSWCGLLGR